MSTLVIRNLNRIYTNHFFAVKDFTLEVADREFMVIAGPSECGKSVLLRIIAGLEEASSGEVFIDDELITVFGAKHRGIGLILKNVTLYPDMTVYDNLAFALKLKKYSKADTQKVVNKIASMLEIESILDKESKDLTEIEVQRVIIGRVLVKEPKVILIDDFISGTESQNKNALREDLVRLQKKLGITMLYVTEDPAEALMIGERIAVMKEGVLLQIGSADELYNHPENMAVAGAIMKPSMNFIEVRIDQDGSDLYMKFLNQRIKLKEQQAKVLQKFNYTGKVVVAGIHAQDVTAVPLENQKEERLFVGEVKACKTYNDKFYAYFDFAGGAFAVHMQDNTVVQPEERVTFSVEIDKVLFFDKETGEAIQN